MEIKPVQQATHFKAFSNLDMYRLEQKIDQLRSQLDKDGDLNSFYKDLPKERRIPMPLGVPPYVMAGMPAPMLTPPMPLSGMPPMGLYGMPPMGPMGPMGMPPMGPPPFGMPPMGPPPTDRISSRLSGQPPMDIFAPKRPY